jgi:hypothetical protein
MEKIFEASKRINLTIAPSFTQTFSIWRVERGFRVYVEGRMVHRYSFGNSGLYAAEGVREVAAHYGFEIPTSVQL